jgi:hypothetical protein
MDGTFRDNLWNIYHMNTFVTYVQVTQFFL